MLLGHSVYSRRTKRVKKALADRGLDAIIVSRPHNVIYMGFNHLPTERPICMIVPVEGEPYLLTPLLEFEHAKKTPWIKEVKLWYQFFPPKVPPIETLANILEETNLADKKIGVEDELMGLALKRRLNMAQFFDSPDIVLNMRMIKSEEEIGLIKKACRFTDLLMGFLVEYAEPEISELDLMNKAIFEATGRLTKEFSEIEAFAPLVKAKVNSGPKSILGHATATNRRLKAGDNLLLYATAFSHFAGYHGHLVRTSFLGRPTQEDKKRYELVLRAEEAALEISNPGIRACDIHEKVMYVMRKAGFESNVWMRTGFGIGIQTHERPYLAEGDQTILKPGMTLRINTGIYIPDRGAYKVADNILITQKSFELLTKYPKNLKSITIGV